MKKARSAPAARAQPARRRPRNAEGQERRLGDLESVGPATLSDFSTLGIRTVEELAGRDATELYDELCRARGVRLDPCCEDVFAAAIAQARDPELPPEQRRWWFWSGVRKRRTVLRSSRKLDAGGS